MVVVTDTVGELKEPISRVAHCRHDYDDVLTCPVSFRDAQGDVADPIGVGHRRAAVLLDDEGHLGVTLPVHVVGPD